MTLFLLGSHQPGWLDTTRVPLFISDRRLTSADSMAWSVDARRKPPLPGCTRHKNCANCPRYALRWRRQVLAATRRAAPIQMEVSP